MKYEYYIGARYLKSRRKSTFISLITLLSITGVAVGVMTLIVVISVMTGYETEITSRILGVESHALIMHYGSPFTAYDKVIKEAKQVEGVKSASPFVFTQIMLRSAKGISGAVIRGIDPDSDLKDVEIFKKFHLDKLRKSIRTDETVHSAEKIILGKELAAKLKVKQGDLIQLTSSRKTNSSRVQVPSIRRIVVAGVFDSGMYEYDATLAYMNLKDTQALLNLGDSVTGIEVRVDDIYEADTISARLNELLDAPLWARDWMRMNRNLFSMLTLQKTVLFIILILIVIVAAFNIASTLIMIVIEKTKDIAILRAMGATDAGIRKIFLYKGMLIGVVGTLIGLTLGMTACALLKEYHFIKIPGDIYYLTTLPVKMVPFDILLIISSALLICFVATLYPAHRASKLDPVEGIRYG